MRAQARLLGLLQCQAREWGTHRGTGRCPAAEAKRWESEGLSFKEKVSGGLASGHTAAAEKLEQTGSQKSCDQIWSIRT